MTMTHLTLSSLLLTATAATTATVDETKFHTYQHPKTNEPRLVLKPVDVAGFYNHPKAAKRTVEGRHLEKLEVASSGNTYDINICNLSVDKQDLKLLPETEGADAVHLATLQKFSCIEATVVEGLKLCFHAKQHHLSSRECQYQATSFQEDGDMMFDPYEHYNELADITGQLEYHGLTTLEPDDLESYLNLKAEMDSATEYRRLSNGQRHLMIATRHESDHQAAHRETMEDAGLKMWNSDYYGQEHTVDDERMVIKAVANSPRVFEIQDFLSKEELKHIQELSSEEDAPATSLHRYDSNQLEEIFQRVSKVFQVDEHQDHEMQVHHVSDTSVMPCHQKIKIHPKEHSQRIASLIMFLDEDSEEAKQEIQFERWEHLEEHEDTLRLTGNAGNALLVYHMLEDGNSDEFAHWTFSAGEAKKYATIHLSDELLKKMVVHEPLDY